MKIVVRIADLVAVPDTFGQAAKAMTVMVPLVLAAVWLDHLLDSAAPAALAGCVWGSLTTFGSIRKLCVSKK